MGTSNPALLRAIAATRVVAAAPTDRTTEVLDSITNLRDRVALIDDRTQPEEAPDA